MSKRIEAVDPSEIDELYASPDAVMLKILQRQRRPIFSTDLLEKVTVKCGYSVSDSLQTRILDGLRTDGYDIKTIYSGDLKSYVMVRNPEVTTDDYYTVLGDVETPFIISGDQHIGSKGFTEMGLKQLISDAEEFSVSNILMPGDVLQGRGVHGLEANDVELWNIDDQMDKAVEVLNRFPKDVNIKIVMGNHENKIKGSVRVGLDVFRHIAPRVKKMQYYGNVAKFMLNDTFSMLMLHSSGGGAYARSYPAQKLWRELVERPDILVQGHLHWVYAIPTARFKMWTMGGTLQRENAYLINKGIIAQPGWLIVEKFSEGTMDVKYRFPEVY